jgi:hypothetical protein
MPRAVLLPSHAAPSLSHWQQLRTHVIGCADAFDLGSLMHVPRRLPGGDALCSRSQ